jgi:hypothetical protein
MIVLGVILILVGYLLPVPAIIATIGWILPSSASCFSCSDRSDARSVAGATGIDPQPALPGGFPVGALRAYV